MRSGLLQPRLLARRGNRVRVALIATGATLLGGDEVAVDLHVSNGLTLELVDVAATVAYHGRGAAAFWENRIRVDDGSALVWAAEPLIVADGAQVNRRTEVNVADGGRLLLRDTLALGRTAAVTGALVCSTRMHLAGRPALAEDLQLDATSITHPGITGGHRVVDTLTALGFVPDQPDPAPAATIMRLTEPGLMARRLVNDAHDSDIAPLARHWASAAQR